MLRFIGTGTWSASFVTSTWVSGVIWTEREAGFTSAVADLLGPASSGRDLAELRAALAAQREPKAQTPRCKRCCSWRGSIAA